jgi:hypothetical protein
MEKRGKVEKRVAGVKESHELNETCEEELRIKRTEKMRIFGVFRDDFV